VTHTYIQAIKQPTLPYLTRSVRRRAATSKRDNLPSWYSRVVGASADTTVFENVALALG
jgi:hypothetical protein